jgi:hypothetical protein
MSLEQLQADYITFRKIAEECGVPIYTAYNWANYHRYFEKQSVLGKPLVLRSQYEAFKREHPELIKAPVSA